MRTLIIFAKVPQPGEVKTRLAAQTPLSPQQACALYEAFLKDVVTMAAMTTAQSVLIHYTPASGERAMRKIVSSLKLGAHNEKRFGFAPQDGETFTQRISNSFRLAAKSDDDELVMIGSDSPLLTPEAIDDAFDFIYFRSGMVLGPSGEGGAYMIGLPSAVKVDFESVFTTGAELENLLEIARASNMPFKLTAETLDVDVEEDLVSLLVIVRAMSYERGFSTRLFPTYTHKALEALNLRVVRDEGGATRGKSIELAGD